MSWPYNWPWSSAPKFVPASGGNAPTWSTPMTFREVVDDLTNGCGCACHTGIGYNALCEHCWLAAPSPSEESGE